MHTYDYKHNGVRGYTTVEYTDADFAILQAGLATLNAKEFNTVIRHYRLPRDFSTTAQWAENFDEWAASVLSGDRDEELLATLLIGPTTLENIKRALRASRGLPEPAPTQSSPASKAKATVRPDGVSYSIHVDNVHNAVALSWLASVFDDQGVYDMALDSLSMLLHHIAEGYYPEQSTPEADKIAIQSMERLIEKIRKANQ